MQLYLTSHGSLATKRATPYTGSSKVVSRSEESMALRRCWMSCGQTKGGSSYLTDVQLAEYMAHSAMSIKPRPRNAMRPRYAATTKAFATEKYIAATLQMDVLRQCTDNYGFTLTSSTNVRLAW